VLQGGFWLCSTRKLYTDSGSGTPVFGKAVKKGSGENRAEGVVNVHAVKRMYPCEPVGVEFINEAPYRVVNRIDLPILSSQLFDVLTDVDAWPRWFPVITRAEWIGDAPRGVGSTRTVVMRGDVVATEQFLAWKPHSQLVFRFNECSNPNVRASAEEYRIEQTDKGCRLTWTMAQDPVGASRLLTALVRWFMNRNYRKALTELRRYTAQRFGTVI